LRVPAGTSRLQEVRLYLDICSEKGVHQDLQRDTRIVGCRGGVGIAEAAAMRPGIVW
jgi:ribose 5-phosphate isomerase RpiB